MQRAWLSFFVVTLFAIALGVGSPSQATAVDSPFIVKGANPPGIQVTATATFPAAIATAIPTIPTAGAVDQGSNVIFVIALLVIAGGAALLWRRQQSRRDQNM